MARRKDRVIARFEYRNGRFGTNHGFISRVYPSDWLPGGYAVQNGCGGDPFFYTSPVEAKRAYRDALAYAFAKAA